MPAASPTVRLYPPMTMAARLAPSPRELVTIVNPEKMKGGEVFREIASAMPDERFLVQLGRGRPVRGIDALPNVTLEPAVADLRATYARTDVLLVPSTCPETFGRVAFEAALAGSLVLCHRTAGMAEVPLPDACFVDDLQPATWVRRLRELRSMSAAERAALRLDVDRAMEAWEPGWAAARAAILRIARAPSELRPVPGPRFSTVASAMHAMRDRLLDRRRFLPFVEGRHRFVVAGEAWTFDVSADDVRLREGADANPTSIVTFTAAAFVACVEGRECFEHVMNRREEPASIRYEGPKYVGNRLSLMWTAPTWNPPA